MGDQKQQLATCPSCEGVGSWGWHPADDHSPAGERVCSECHGKGKVLASTIPPPRPMKKCPGCDRDLYVEVMACSCGWKAEPEQQLQARQRESFIEEVTRTTPISRADAERLCDIAAKFGKRGAWEARDPEHGVSATAQEDQEDA